MEGALGWIGELMRALGALIPRLAHLECTDIGLTIKRGCQVNVLHPGLHWYWPLWTEFYRRPGNVQTATLPKQALVTLDGKNVVVGGMVRYQFDRDTESVKRALIETEDVESAIEDESLALFCDLATLKTFNEIQKDRTKVNRSLTDRLATQMRRYGVDLQRAQLTDFSPCTTLNHTGRGVLTGLEEEG